MLTTTNSGAHGASNKNFKWFIESWFEEIAATNMVIKGTSGDEIQHSSNDPLIDILHILCSTPRTTVFGTLERNQYMHLPNNYKIPECPVNHIGAGANVYDPCALSCAGVYALAKAQALDFGWEKEKAIKWAVLRMEALIAGWFDNQDFITFKHPPINFITTFVQDRNEIMKHSETAWILCNFIPFLAEFQFRAYGTCYQRTDGRAEYVRRANSLATTSGLNDILTYLDNDTLFGISLMWVDVKRPMKALNDSEACCRVFDVFKERLKRAPAGQALITTSVAIIASMEKANFWSRIKEGNYEDEKLITVSQKILADPWRYHFMSHAYSAKQLSKGESDEVEKAKQLAIMFAAVLQAFSDIFLSKTDLGKAKALRKYANANSLLYSRAVKEFRRVKREQSKTGVITEFDNNIFEPENIFLSWFFQPQKKARRQMD